ncbi:MAG TPA: family 1 glycosylhydrolase, partial [Acidimicrobiales bacterium]|nr:family 1 glycosylhydrolase [Acidimicrobiales bacterium]
MPAEAKKGLVPPDLLLGVALGGWVVEGGFNGPGQPANNWVRWERSGLAGPTAGRGHFWEAPEELLDRVAALGCDAVGLSVEWARLEPEEGRPDEAALERYADLLALCRQRGLAPVVTLSYQAHPWWLGEELWLTPGAPDRFAEHVGRVVPRLAGSCDRWVTVHQPNRLALGGWVGGDLPPRRRGAVADGWAAIDNLLTAHVLAYRAIHRVQPEATVTLDTAASALYDYDGLLVDLLCARH